MAVRSTGICRPDGAGEWGGAVGGKDFAPDGAAANSNGVESFSPALAGAVGLRWVNGQNETTLKELWRQRQTAKDAKYANPKFGFSFRVFCVVRG